MIFDLYTTLQIHDRPKITVLRREMARVWAMDNPIGDPFGGPAYGEFNKPIQKAVESVGKWIDREVLKPVYKEVIQPVGKALEKIGQGIAKDPLTFIAQAAAVALAPVTAGQSLWALPVIAAASTAAKGGSLDQILTATAISAATAAVGGGFGLENSVGGLITNGLQTGVNAAGQATFGIMGTSITASTAQAIATAGQGLAMGAVAATGAAATGKDPFQAALPSLVGTALGFAGNQVAQADFFKPITQTLSDISTNVSPIVSKALTGVASAMITGAVTGKDMSQVAIASLANTAVSGLVSASNVVADFFRNDQGGITNMGAATQSIVADLLGSVAATVASGGKMGPAMGAQFLANATNTLVPFLNPEFDALATNVQLTYKDAEGKVKAVNDAANAQQGWVDKYNKDADTLNKLADSINADVKERDKVVDLYNKATTQADIDKYKAQFNTLEKRIADNTKSYNTIYDTIDDTNASYLQSVKDTEAAQKAYFEVSKTLGTLGTQLSSKMNEASKALTETAAKQIDPNFNAEEYKALNNLGPGIDAATHYMSTGKDQGLFTNYADAEPQRETMVDKATATLLRANGWGSVANVPQDVYDATRDRIANYYGNNMQGLANFTVESLVTQSKMPATWFAPMWDENSKTITNAKVLFNGGTNGQVVIADTVLPEGMSVANFYDVQSGKANVTRGSDGNFYWTTNTGVQARIYDPKTGEVVQTTYSNYFADQDVPAGATNITRDEQGRVVGYTSKDGVMSIVVSGVNNPQAEYNNFGTQLDQTDPFVQMSTYANVTDGIAANFNIKGVVQASKDIVDYMQKDATDLQKLQIATIVKSGGSVLQDVGTVLQDLSVTIGLSKAGETGTLASLGKQLENLASAKTPEQYKAAMADIEAMRKAAQGTDIVAVNAAIAQKYPDLVGISVFGGELFEELIQNGVGKAAYLAGGALAATLGAPALIAGAIGAGVGYGVSMAMDFSESYRGAKEDMYQRMYDIYKEKGYSDAQANQMADAAATKAGVMNGLITMVVNGAAPGDINKVLFGGKASPAQEAITNYFVDKLKTAGTVAASEFGQGLVEGTLQGMYNETLVYSVDPSKADYKKGMADSAMLESIIGAPVSAGAYAVDNSFDMTRRTFTLANEQFTKAINSGTIYTVGELGSVFNQWGVPATISAEIVPEIISSKPTLLSAYSTPAELTTALKNSFGFDAAQSADIANIKFNNQITTTQEAKDKLLAAGLTGVTDKDAVAAGIVGVNGTDQASKVSTYTNQQMVSLEELQATAKQENYTATDAELKALVGRGVQADVIAQFIKDIDPKAVTTAEATQYFKDLGYTKATAVDIAQFVKSAPEAEVQKAVAAWVDPRQVTRAEAIQFFKDQGYTPTEAEIATYVVQGPDVAQATVKKNLETYVNPRYTTIDEVRAAAAREGYAISDEEAAKYVGQFTQATQEAAVQKYSDPLAVLADEATQYFATEGYTPTVEELKKFTGVRNEADTAKLIIAYADPLVMTDAEARTYMKELGYTAPTAAEVKQFVKQAKESDVYSALQSYVDVHQVTRTEAINFFASFGYKPTEAEISSYIKQGAGISQDDVKNQLGTYVDPRMVDAGEVREAFKALGLDAPVSEADIARYSGQYAESELAAKAKAGLPLVSTNALYALMSGGVGAGSGYSQATIDAISKQIEDYKNLGLNADQAQTAAINAVAAQLGTTKTELLTSLGKTEAALKADINAVNTKLTTVQTSIMDKMATYEAQGMARDEALSKSITDVATNLGTTKTDLLKQIGQTETNLGAKITATQTALTTKISDTETSILKKMSEYENAGLARDVAQDKAISDVSSQLGLTKTELAAKIGTTEENLTAKINASQAVMTTKLEAVQSTLLAKVAEYQAQGMASDAAMTKAIDAVASNLGTTKTELLGQIGQTEAKLTDAINTKVAATERAILDKMEAYEAAGMSRDQAIQKSVDAVSAQLGTAKSDLIAAIGSSESKLGSKIDALQKQEQENYTSLQSKMAEYQAQGLSADAALQKAIGAVSDKLGVTESNLMASLGKTQAQLQTDINALSTKIGSVQTAVMNKMAEYEAAGKTRDEALSKSISDVAGQLGTTKDTLLAQIGQTETSLGNKISTIQSQLSAQIGDTEKSILSKMAQYQAEGMSRDNAQQQAIAEVSQSLGTTREELLNQIGATEETLSAKLNSTQAALNTKIDNVQSNIMSKMSEYQAQGMASDAALQKAIDTVSTNLGTTKSDLLAQINTTEAAITKSVNDKISATEQSLMNKISSLEAAGLSRDQAIQKSVDAVSAQLGTTREELLARIGSSESDLTKLINSAAIAGQQYTKEQIQQATTLLQDQIAANQAAGMDAIAATNKAVKSVADQLGITATALQSAIASSSEAGMKYTQQQVQQATTILQNQIDAYQKAGMDANTATNKAIKDLSDQLGVSSNTLLAQMGTNQQQLLDQIVASQQASQQFTKDEISNATKQLQTQMAAYEQAGLDRDTATNLAISSLAQDLGVAKEELLAKMGTTEANLTQLIQASAQAGQAYTQQQVQAATEQLTALMTQYQQQGMEANAATNKAVADLAAQLGTTANNLLAQMGTNQAELQAQMQAIAQAGQQFTEQQINAATAAIQQQMQANMQAGMASDAALQKAINDVASQSNLNTQTLLNKLGTTADQLRTEFSSGLTNLQSQIADQMSAYEKAGMDRDTALSLAISGVAQDLGTTKANLLSQLGTTEANLAAQIAASQQSSQQYTQQQVQALNQQLTSLINANQQAGMDAVAATNKAVADLATQLGVTANTLMTNLGTSVSQLQSQIATGQQLTQQQIATATAALQAQITANQQAGMDAIAATNKAVQDVAAQLGITTTNLQSQIAASNSQLAQQIAQAQQAGQQYTQQQVQQSQTAIMEKMAQYEAAGMSRDAALNKAISDVSTQLGTTANNLLAQMGTNQQQLLAQLGQTQTQLQSDLAKAKQDIQTQMAAYEQAGIDRDTALSLAITGVSQQLGTTRSDLLSQLGTTEANLKTEFTAQISGVSQQVQDVAKLLGKPASQVTSADITNVQNMIAGTSAVNMGYDVNQDGKVDTQDLTLIQQQQQIQQGTNVTETIDPNTGLSVYTDKTTGQVITGFTPVGGSPWASTGIYSVLDQQKAQQAATAKAQAASAKEAQRKNQFTQMMQMVLGSPDIGGQKVDVSTPAPKPINYYYDWSSIFATPQQASMMPSPYGAINTYGATQQPQRGLGGIAGLYGQAANQPMYKQASGFAEGGMINNDISVGDGGSVDDLLNILKGNG